MSRAWFGALALATIGSAGCGRSASAPVYLVSPVVRRDIRVTTRASGFIQPDTIVIIKSKTSGEILTLAADAGQLVQRGTVMARIDRRAPRNAVAQAEAALAVAQSRLGQAKVALRRSDQLLATRSIAQQEHDSVSLAVTDANAAAIAAKLDLDNARIALANTDVIAPITGTILSRAVERGQMVSSPSGDVAGGTEMFQMADLTHMQVQAEVDETDIGRLAPGQTATIEVTAFPGIDFDGRVLKVEPMPDTLTTGVTMFIVRVRIDRPGDRLIAGMRADVEFDLAVRRGALAVPNAALELTENLGIPRPEGDSSANRIVLANRGGVATPVTIVTGVTDFDYTELLSGLREGDSVLVASPDLDDRARAALRRRLADAQNPPRRPAAPRVR